ncbi:uncharacterized aarF domain-containing protein kinase 2 [Brienomyrus brachyistius]|uniref:uncharacterized aarF domain-containing protein kinase 2 n=1 Tax=Brienomyrus brachyistius TaxID=42636 RepID=UPI0020B32E2A|nr:uncharacterized aarF domain-containing protein kinase 2 [Brienomyrus brachyistius]
MKIVIFKGKDHTTITIMYFKLAAFSGRRFLVNLKCTVKKVKMPHLVTFRSASFQPCQRGSMLIKVPLAGLLCWGTVNVASCQEVLAPQQRKFVVKVRIDRIGFALRVGLRSLVLLLKFSPLLLLYPLCLFSWRLRGLWLDALLWVTETSGPTFIKLGQWASTRRDLFSPEFCDRFSKLHVRVPAHSWTHTQRCLNRAFGDTWRQLFVFQNREPVGSGCVAQVYRAMARVDRMENPAFHQWLEQLEGQDLLEAWEIPGLSGVLALLLGRGRDVGDELREAETQSGQGERGPDLAGNPLMPVAIKVLHPGIKGRVQVDLLLMHVASRLLSLLPGLRWLSLPEVVQEFEKLMTKQIDLRYEAENFERFQVNFQNVDAVRFPTPLRPFVTRDVLVETFEESEPISSFLGQEVPEDVKRKIARMGVDALLKMVFVDNFVHGDLHPGNILVQGDGGPPPPGTMALTDLCDTVVVTVRPSGPPMRLVLLDAGIVSWLSDGDLRNFRAVFTAVVHRQGEKVAELILTHARASKCTDVPRFKQEMAALVNEALSHTLSLGKVQVGDLLTRVFKLLMAHKVKLESNFASIVFAIIVLEGLGRSLDPNLDILEIAKPLLLRNAASLI